MSCYLLHKWITDCFRQCIVVCAVHFDCPWTVSDQWPKLIHGSRKSMTLFQENLHSLCNWLPRTSQTTVAFCRTLVVANCSPVPMTFGSCLCHEHITNSVIGVSPPPVLDCGTTFHLDSGGRDLPSTLSDNLWQEAPLSPSDRAMRLVSSNFANYHATVQKILIRQVLTKPMVWSWRFSWRQCVINKPTTVELCISPVYRRLAVAKFFKVHNVEIAQVTLTTPT